MRGDVMPHGIHIYACNSDSLNKWINAGLLIMKNLVSHRKSISDSWVMYYCCIDNM